MDHKDIRANGVKTRSFRYEDYNNRRMFLRSYPLQWDREDNGADENISRETKENAQKKPIKQMILSIIHWGEGNIVIFRRFKNKLTVYVLACILAGCKPRAALILA